LMPALDQTPWEALFPMDAVTPMTCVHQGIEYPGEVVRSGRWLPRHGQAPGKGYHFKIVLLQESARDGLPEAVDQRTAVCIPASGSGRQVHRIIGEITAAKQAEYLTRRDVDAAAINSALRERRYGLESRLAAEESARLAKGAIFVSDQPGPDPAKIFSSGDPMDCMESLAGWLLARSYPRLPLDTHSLAQPICEDDIGRLFASIFGHPTADPGLLSRLGPAMGLSLLDSSGVYNPSECPIFSLIQEKIGPGPALFVDLHHYLAYEVGLADQAASLYLMLFIQHEFPEHQIQLLNGAAMFMADGGPLLGTRLTPDLIPLLAWEPNLESQAESIGPASAPSFSDARHHLSVLCPELATCDPDKAAETLFRSLESFSRDSATASHLLDSLETNWNAGPDEPGDAGKLKAVLDRLNRISADDYAEVYQQARAAYPRLPELKEDLETMRQLVTLDGDSSEIFEAQRYVVDARVPSTEFPNLAVDREALLTGLSPSRLVRSKGRGWSAVARDAAAFKVRYTQAYREHHRRYHDALPGFQATLLAAKKKSAALELLNTIVELGTPVGTALREAISALPPGPNPCSTEGSTFDLSSEPVCPECHIGPLARVSADRAGQRTLFIGEHS